MNRKQATALGLEFTGIHGRNKQEIKKRIAKERIRCRKAKIALVTIPDGVYSGNPQGNGYAAYADKVYKAYKIIEQSRKVLKCHGARVEDIRAEYWKAYRIQAEKCSDALNSLRRAEGVLNKTNKKEGRE